VYAEGYLGGGDDVYDTGRVDGTTGSEIFSDERTVAAVGATYYF
jgi:hypothetical protein